MMAEKKKTFLKKLSVAVKAKLPATMLRSFKSTDYIDDSKITGAMLEKGPSINLASRIVRQIRLRHAQTFISKISDEIDHKVTFCEQKVFLDFNKKVKSGVLPFYFRLAPLQTKGAKDGVALILIGPGNNRGTHKINLIVKAQGVYDTSKHTVVKEQQFFDFLRQAKAKKFTFKASWEQIIKSIVEARRKEARQHKGAEPSLSTSQTDGTAASSVPQKASVVTAIQAMDIPVILAPMPVNPDILKKIRGYLHDYLALAGRGLLATAWRWVKSRIFRLHTSYETFNAVHKAWQQIGGGKAGGVQDKVTYSRLSQALAPVKQVKDTYKGRRLSEKMALIDGALEEARKQGKQQLERQRLEVKRKAAMDAQRQTEKRADLKARRKARERKERKQQGSNGIYRRGTVPGVV